MSAEKKKCSIQNSRIEGSLKKDLAVLLSVREGGNLQLLSSKTKSKVTFLSQVIATALKMKEGAFHKQRAPLFIS